MSTRIEYFIKDAESGKVSTGFVEDITTKDQEKPELRTIRDPNGSVFTITDKPEFTEIKYSQGTRSAQHTLTNSGEYITQKIIDPSEESDLIFKVTRLARQSRKLRNPNQNE